MKKDRLKDILATLINSWIGTVIVLFLDWLLIIKLNINNIVSLLIANTVSATTGTLVLDGFYKTKHNLRRLLFNLISCILCVLIASLIPINELIHINNQTLHIVIAQGLIGILQFIWGLISNILAYRILKFGDHT